MWPNIQKHLSPLNLLWLLGIIVSATFLRTQLTLLEPLNLFLAVNSVFILIALYEYLTIYHSQKAALVASTFLAFFPLEIITTHLFKTIFMWVTILLLFILEHSLKKDKRYQIKKIKSLQPIIPALSVSLLLLIATFFSSQALWGFAVILPLLIGWSLTKLLKKAPLLLFALSLLWICSACAGLFFSLTA